MHLPHLASTGGAQRTHTHNTRTNFCEKHTPKSSQAGLCRVAPCCPTLFDLFGYFFSTSLFSSFFSFPLHQLSYTVLVMLFISLPPHRFFTPSYPIAAFDFFLHFFRHSFFTFFFSFSSFYIRFEPACIFICGHRFGQRLFFRFAPAGPA